ncbi:MAG: cell division protein FtsZ, partial [Acidobacteriota bacterium]
DKSRAPTRLQIGEKAARGLGVGAKPEKGKEAALEDTERIIQLLEGADMVFITAGLGGGTGTGAAPIVANLSINLNALTVGIVTLPFKFEGRRKLRLAEEGLLELKENCDTVIVIPNQRLLETVGRDTTVEAAFEAADDVLRQAVQGISDAITMYGQMNVDFSDVRTVMSYTGMALMGTGVASGEERAVTAAREAISSPLLENCTIEGARGVLINITGPSSLTLVEMSAACEIIEDTAHEDALIIIGRVLDDTMGENVKITVIATGFEDKKSASEIQRVPARLPLDFPESFRIKEDLFFQNETETARETREDLDWLDAPTFLRNRKAQ